jgi:hypothetical protein
MSKRKTSRITRKNVMYEKNKTVILLQITHFSDGHRDSFVSAFANEENLEKGIQEMDEIVLDRDLNIIVSKAVIDDSSGGRMTKELLIICANAINKRRKELGIRRTFRVTQGVQEHVVSVEDVMDVDDGQSN